MQTPQVPMMPYGNMYNYRGGNMSTVYHNSINQQSDSRNVSLSVDNGKTNQEDVGDFDLSFFINQITSPPVQKPEPNVKTSIMNNPYGSTSNTFIPFESKINPFLSQQSNDALNPVDNKNQNNSFTMTIAPDFSALDPISFVKQESKTRKRKLTREDTNSSRNNQPILEN